MQRKHAVKSSALYLTPSVDAGGPELQGALTGLLTSADVGMASRLLRLVFMLSVSDLFHFRVAVTKSALKVSSQLKESGMVVTINMV